MSGLLHIAKLFDLVREADQMHTKRRPSHELFRSVRQIVKDVISVNAHVRYIIGAAN